MCKLAPYFPELKVYRTKAATATTPQLSEKITGDETISFNWIKGMLVTAANLFQPGDKTVFSQILKSHTICVFIMFSRRNKWCN